MGCGGSTSRATEKKKTVPEPIPVLGYWNIQARGDPARLLLHHLGVKFEDKQYVFGETSGPKSWSANKTKLGMVIPNLPYWKDGDVIHAETVPVLKSICRKYCPTYMGRTQAEQAAADSFASTIYGGLLGFFMPYMFRADYAEKKEEGLEAAKGYLDLIERCIGSKRFIAGNEPTYADFITYWILKVLKMYAPTIFDGRQAVTYMRNFTALKGIQTAENAYKDVPPFLPLCNWWKDRMPGAKAPAKPTPSQAPAKPTPAQAPVKPTPALASAKPITAPEVKGPKPILGYWGIQGRGDPCRMLLHNLGVDFEDKHYVMGETSGENSWPANKGQLGTPFPNLPYWKDGDIIHSETIPVIRSICRKYKPEYMGRNQTEQAYADSFTGTINGAFVPWFMPHMFREDYASKRVEGTAKGKELAEMIVNCLGNKKFIAGNDITYVDFVSFWLLKILNLYDKSIVGSFPKLGQYMELFSSQKGITEAAKA